MNLTVRFVVVECCNEACRCTFAMTEEMNDAYRKNHATWCCPAGHRQSYTGKSTEEELRRERDRLAQRVAEREDQIRREQDRRKAAVRSANAYRGRVTRIKNRVANGVCPCCNRSFTNLHEHMKTQHPDFKKMKEPAT